MKAVVKIFGLCLVLLLVVQSCSRKKDKWLNRNFHAMGTKYNVLYNGNLALQSGLDAINDAYSENFWELLPVERMQVDKDVIKPGQSQNADFQRAEEKAIKAVQTHDMVIKGKEKNPQIDEAYLLLGQARYYDQRFIQALEAFNYILFKYPTSDKINTTKVWREKTNIRLDNNELAIKNLNELIETEQLSQQDMADATAILAQAYVNMNAKDLALEQIKIALENTKSNSYRARYKYIIAQLHEEFEEIDSAKAYYSEIIEMHRKIPRPYYINAHLSKIRLQDLNNYNKLEYEEYLTKLEEDRENRPFLGKIYYQIAQYYQNIESDSVAEVYYNKSLRSQTTEQKLKAINYSILGDMYFDRSVYRTAGAYYDSTMTNHEERSKMYRLYKRKRDNLQDVIFYEGVAQRNDSILKLVSMSDEERALVFTDIVEKIKKRDEEREKLEDAAKRDNSGLTQAGQNMAPLVREVGDTGKKESSFYFYNPTSVAFGKNEFLKIWGDRPLEDNWRWSTKGRSVEQSISAEDELLATATDEERYDINFYLSKIPSEPKEIDSIAKDRNYAYYQLGLIYKEKFNELNLAKDKLQILLGNNPEERLVLPAKYNLYKIYELLGQTDQANIAKQDILSNYPDSRYAELIRNPRAALDQEANSAENLYKKLFEAFENQNYEQVLTQCEKAVLDYDGDDMVPKFEILKAAAKGRLEGFEAYKEAVNYVALTYPNSEEGKRASELLNTAIPIMAKKDWYNEEDSENFYIVYQFENETEENIKKFAELMEQKVKNVNYFDLTVSKDVYDRNTTFVVVHGLKSINGAKGFAQILNEDKKNKTKITRPYFSICSENYAIVQRHKNLNAYLDLQ
ncbi:hypothetical protein FJ651_05465 [Paucihalobacter ruber]|uniref:Protein involved in gliding motility SprE n=1 Tax=Paucihalobacter ruber TaxID=2567861 RepID=A0A506PM87_9FLAO|nr:hypothetical protein [Paucihalobacter ruber]TPV34976.1 hypothetical protein FJ651_05465 [Paucihalobacter ruber]